MRGRSDDERVFLVGLLLIFFGEVLLVIGAALLAGWGATLITMGVIGIVNGIIMSHLASLPLP